MKIKNGYLSTLLTLSDKSKILNQNDDKRIRGRSEKNTWR